MWRIWLLGRCQFDQGLTEPPVPAQENEVIALARHPLRPHDRDRLAPVCGRPPAKLRDHRQEGAQRPERTTFCLGPALQAGHAKQAFAGKPTGTAGNRDRRATRARLRCSTCGTLQGESRLLERMPVRESASHDSRSRTTRADRTAFD